MPLLRLPKDLCVTPHHHITIVLSSLNSQHLSIEHRTHPSLTILHPDRAHNSSFCLLDTSFVASIMTVISVWERKKEKKKGEEAKMATAAISTTVERAMVSNPDDDDVNDDGMSTSIH
jgi:hypothetical protein